MILHQCLDSFTSTRTFLYLIKDDKRFARSKSLLVMQLYVLKKSINILQILIKTSSHTCWCIAEINKDI